jgi:hypothetical protein
MRSINVLALALLLYGSPCIANDTMTPPYEVNEQSERIPSLTETIDIEVSHSRSDSGAYLVVHASGKLTSVPFRSQIHLPSKKVRTTTDAVVDFSLVYERLAEAAVLNSTSEGDRLVYFIRRNSDHSIAVYIPASQTAVAQSLFEAFEHAQTRRFSEDSAQ